MWFDTLEVLYKNEEHLLNEGNLKNPEPLAPKLEELSRENMISIFNSTLVFQIPEIC